ncbi:hypothetical protein KAFR_0D04590 [Kazachstania africana CBS 2517]|uniref:Zn(2)-C6 fungal-type domain-containing protein n=1 Tax=Kazachstania africana (strain ATCC 22294 / BCRC 22015 / CBS 2517 / CECT 1963 / NBRC 1671 / NRRL Y-8276) TaxID=1071382 RepID=H2AUQ7_KAZAF|nr:hypothetical protein KAFR_0D04590 [Kazachstania africana CBS 2517]CCF58107.1 hypothetical protein KAFR_0D04590 [Kazachstania africana CBS 2517]
MDAKSRKFRKPPACTQCRKRKIGCDRVRPVCNNCLKGHRYDCTYPDTHGQVFNASLSLGPSTSIKSYTPKKSNEFKFVASSGNISGGINSMTQTRQLRRNPQLNADIVSIEQIGQYNTHLQLLNNKNKMKMSLNDLFHSNDALNDQIKYNDLDYPFYLHNLIDFDIMISNLTQEEVLLKEMEFLKLRYLELKKLQSKRMSQSNMSNSINTNKLESSPTSNVKTDNANTEGKINGAANNETNETGFESEDEDDEDENNFINQLHFSILESRKQEQIETLSLKDRPSALFHKNFLILRDDYLTDFYMQFQLLINSTFSTQIRNDNGRISSPNNGVLLFPNYRIIQSSIHYINENLSSLQPLLPFWQNESDFSADLLIKSNEINVFKISMEQLSKLGILTISLILVKLSIKFSISVNIKTQYGKLLDSLNKINLYQNLIVIKDELLKNLKISNTKDISIVKFLSFWKFFYHVIDTNSISADKVEFDEDIYLSYNNLLPNESEDVEKIKLWNFIFKNYLERNLSVGISPDLVLDNYEEEPKEIFHNLIIKNNDLLNNIDLLKSGLELVKTLHLNTTHNTMISIGEVKSLKKAVRNKFEDKISNNKNDENTINNILISQIYYKISISSNYLLMLQYENDNNLVQFQKSMVEFIKLLETVLINQFINLNNSFGKLNNYEFLFMKRSMDLIELIVTILFALLLRIKALGMLDSSDTNNTDNEAFIRFGKLMLAIFNKVETMIVDYNKVTSNEVINKLLITIRTMQIFIQKKHNNNNSSVITKNGFRNVEPERIEKYISTLKNFSKLLINDEIYETKKPGLDEFNGTTIDNEFGISEQNFKQVYSSFF